MPLFEIVLTEPGGRTEVQHTDSPARVGDTIQVQEVSWVVIRKERAAPPAYSRLICVRVQEAGGGA